MKHEKIKMIMPSEAKHKLKTWSDIPNVCGVSETFPDIYTVRLSFKGGDPLHIAEWMHFNLPITYSTVGNVEVTVVCDYGHYIYRFDLEA